MAETPDSTDGIQALERELRGCRFRASSEAELLASYLERFPETMNYRINAEDAAYLRGKRVMVLGGGGSIGQQLARDLFDYGVGQVILVDIAENGLYAIKLELTQFRGMDESRVTCVLGNKGARQRMRALLDTHRPETVFDFANYKSMVFGNLEPAEFFRLNVGATLSLVETCAEHPAVERFVFASSDKAERPSAPYGRTKRLAELAAQTVVRRSGGLKLGVIRYCNVLDAAGSFALPTFRQQILAGQKVTIRKVEGGQIPDRYFIPRRLASHLTLKVGQLADQGHIYSLDKTRISPIRIDELVALLARQYTTEPIDSWLEHNVCYVPGLAGEKRREQLGRGRSLDDVPLVELHQEQATRAAELDERLRSLQRLIAFMDHPGVSKHAEQVINGTLACHEALTERQSCERIRGELDALFAQYGY